MLKKPASALKRATGTIQVRSSRFEVPETSNFGPRTLIRLARPASLASAGGVQRLEGRGGIIFVEGVQRVLGIELVEGIVGVARVVLVHRIHGAAGIVLIDRVQRILWIVGVDRIQRIIGTVLVERMKDIVIAHVLLREAGFGKRRCDGKEQQEEKEEDNAHGEPPNER